MCISLSTYIINVTAILCILVTKGLVNCFPPIAHRAAASIAWSLLDSPQKSQAVSYLFQKYLYCWKNIHSFCPCSFFQADRKCLVVCTQSFSPTSLPLHPLPTTSMSTGSQITHTSTHIPILIIIIIIMIMIIIYLFIYCNWVVTRWQCLCAHRHINFGASSFSVTPLNIFVTCQCSV